MNLLSPTPCPPARALKTPSSVQCSHGAAILLCLRVFCPLFSVFQLFCVYYFVILISFASYFRLRNVSYFRVHFFICCFCCLVQLLLPLVFQFPLSLCVSCRSRHTNLVSFVIFPSFLLALFVFCFCSDQNFLCIWLSRLSATPGDYVTYSLLLKRSSLCIVLYSFSPVLVSGWQISFAGFYRIFLGCISLL